MFATPKPSTIAEMVMIATMTGSLVVMRYIHIVPVRKKRPIFRDRRNPIAPVSKKRDFFEGPNQTGRGGETKEKKQHPKLRGALASLPVAAMVT